MGLIGNALSMLFGGNRNVIVETAEVFRENSEAAGAREAQIRAAAMAQFGQEFRQQRGWFDQLIDGLNRLPRPALAYGTLGLFVAAMVDPVWFASRMQGIELVPEPLWWLMGAVVSFYFGARHQAHTQAFQRSVADSLSRLPQVTAAQEKIKPRAPRAPQPVVETTAPTRFVSGPNPALSDWFALQT